MGCRRCCVGWYSLTSGRDTRVTRAGGGMVDNAPPRDWNGASRGEGGLDDDRSLSAAPVPSPESLDAESVLDCYELARLPAPTRKGRAEPAANLLALVDRYGVHPRAVPLGKPPAGTPNGASNSRSASSCRAETRSEASLAAQPRPGLWGVMALPDSELETLPVETALLGVEPTLVSPAAKFVMQGLSERSCRGQNGRRGHVAPDQRRQGCVVAWRQGLLPARARQDLLRGRQRGYAR